MRYFALSMRNNQLQLYQVNLKHVIIPNDGRQRHPVFGVLILCSFW